MSYCGRSCQKADWILHKPKCNAEEQARDTRDQSDNRVFVEKRAAAEPPGDVGIQLVNKESANSFEGADEVTDFTGGGSGNGDGVAGKRLPPALERPGLLHLLSPHGQERAVLPAGSAGRRR